MAEEKKIFSVMEKKQYEEMRKGFEYGEYGVLVEIKIDVSEEAIKMIRNATLMKNTQRKTPIYVTNFMYTDGKFTFRVLSPISKEFRMIYGKVQNDSHPLATTFVDFCWLLGEGSTAKTVIEVNTPIREAATLGDLTKVLPSKFADDLIEAMHSLNIEFVEGILGDAVLYGPAFIYKD